jgi:uncharacterized membrane protein
MPNPHPLVIHFPIALLSVAVLFELFARFLHREDFSRCGWWMQLIGTIGLVLAVVTGILARDTVTIAPLARPYFDMHQQMAFLASGLFAVLLFWRIASRSRIPERYVALYLILLVCSVAVLWVGAWYGGEMVYRFGVGLKTIKGLL